MSQTIKEKPLKKSNYIIGIDQSYSQFAISIINKDTFEIKGVFCWWPQGMGIQRLRWIHKRLTLVVKKIRPYAIAREAIIYRTGFAGAGRVLDLAILASRLDEWFDTMGYSEDRNNYFLFQNTVWKKIAFGRGTLSKDTNYLKYILQKTGMEFDNDNVADAFFISQTLGKVLKINSGEIDVQTLPSFVIESMLDKKYVKRMKTTTKTVTKQIKAGNSKLFEQYNYFSTPSWARRFPANPKDKFGRSIAAVNLRQLKKLLAINTQFQKNLIDDKESSDVF